MKPFDAALAADIGATFLNPEEFGAPHILEGLEIIAVVETYDGADAAPGAAQRDALRVHCRTGDIAELRIRSRSSVTLDGKNYTVAARADDLGVTTLQLIRGQG